MSPVSTGDPWVLSRTHLTLIQVCSSHSLSRSHRGGKAAEPHHDGSVDPICPDGVSDKQAHPALGLDDSDLPPGNNMPSFIPPTQGPQW